MGGELYISVNVPPGKCPPLLCPRAVFDWIPNATSGILQGAFQNEASNFAIHH